MSIAEPRLKRGGPPSFDIESGTKPPESGGDDDDGDDDNSNLGCLPIFGIALLIFLAVVAITYLQTRK